MVYSAYPSGYAPYTDRCKQIGKNQQARFFQVILDFKLLRSPFFSRFLNDGLTNV